MTLQFRHFIPKDEDLKFFVSSSSESPVEDILKSIEGRFNESVAAAKESLSQVTKAPKEPNWDLKREFEKRNRPLEKHTQKAISAILAGLSNQQQAQDDQPQQESVTFGNVEEDYDSETSEDDEFRDAKNLMSSLSKTDLNTNEVIENDLVGDS
jgi:coiled-coil domain-containing protein 12